MIIFIYFFHQHDSLFNHADPSLASDRALRELGLGICHDRNGWEYGERNRQKARIVEAISRIGIREIHHFITSHCCGRTKYHHIILAGSRLYLRPASVWFLTFIFQLRLIHINGTQLDDICIFRIPPRHTRTRDTHHRTYGSYQLFIYLIAVYDRIYINILRIRYDIVPILFLTKCFQTLCQIVDIGCLILV